MPPSTSISLTGRVIRSSTSPSVMTVDNLNFLRYPHLYSLPERLVLLRLYRRALRSASRLITVNRDAREELSERLRIDPGRIEVVMPLAARVPHEPPAGAQLEAVRRKYMLPAEFILMLGTVEERHNHKVLIEAVGGAASPRACAARPRRMLPCRLPHLPPSGSGSWSAAAVRSMRIPCWSMLAGGIWPRVSISSTNSAPTTCRRCSASPMPSSTCRCRDRGVDRARGGGDACRSAHGAERHAAQP